MFGQDALAVFAALRRLDERRGGNSDTEDDKDYAERGRKKPGPICMSVPGR